MLGMRRASYDLLGAVRARMRVWGWCQQNSHHHRRRSQFVMCSGLLAVWIMFMLFSYAAWGCTGFNSCATTWANPVWCKTSDLFMWISAVLHVGIGCVGVLGYLWGFKVRARARWRGCEQ